MRRKLLSQRPSPAMLVAIVALISSLTGGAVAATLITGDDIKNGSVTKKDLKKNSVRTKKVKNGTLLEKDFKEGQLPQGEQGPPGAKGDKGDAGADGSAKAWAYVDPSVPSIVRGSGFTTLTRPVAGHYCLTASGLSSTTSAAQVSVDDSESDGDENLAYWVSSGSNCASGQFEVMTKGIGGMPDNAIAFVITVP